jgi:hypothetical protein
MTLSLPVSIASSRIIRKNLGDGTVLQTLYVKYETLMVQGTNIRLLDEQKKALEAALKETNKQLGIWPK